MRDPLIFRPCCSPSLPLVSWPSGRSAPTRSPPIGTRFACCCSSHRSGYARRRLSWNWTDLDASLIGAFLEDLENRRGNGARSRNLRLTAIRSFFRYAALEAPAHAGIIQRVLAIPNQRQPAPWWIF